MACREVGTKSFSDPMPEDCLLSPLEQNEILIETHTFY